MNIEDIKKISEVFFNFTSPIAVVLAAYLTSNKRKKHQHKSKRK